MESTVTFADLIVWLLGSTAFGAAVTGAINYAINRRTTQVTLASVAVTEAKNDADSQDALVARYREAAREEREQKASAVATVRQLLEIAETQIVGLKDTLARLTETVRVMTDNATTQAAELAATMAERNRLAAVLATAEAEAAQYRTQLVALRRQLGELPDTESIRLPGGPHEGALET